VRSYGTLTSFEVTHQSILLDCRCRCIHLRVHLYVNEVHFLSPFGEYWPCPFSFLASQSLYETLILLTMLISAFERALQSGCLVHLFVLCTLLSNRFCCLPSWALPHHSIMMSLSGSVWSSPPLRLSSFQRGSSHSSHSLFLS